MFSALGSLLSLNRLIGPALVTVVYYLGLAIICGLGLFNIWLAVTRLGEDLGAGASLLVAAPAVTIAALAFWRFVCEICIVSFTNHEMLRDLHDRLAQSPSSAQHVAPASTPSATRAEAPADYSSF